MKEKIVKETFPVLQMSCASCAINVETILKSTKGVSNASVNFANNSALIEYDTSVINSKKIQDVVRSIGYDILIEEKDDVDAIEAERQKEYLKLRNKTLLAALFAFPVFIIGMFFMSMPYGNWISLFLSAPVVFYFGKDFFISAIKKLKHKTANMDTLVALSTSIAFLFSTFNTIYPEFWHKRGLHPHVYFESAALIIVFISFGKLLEEKAKYSTSDALKKLMGLQPKSVKIFINNIEKEVPVNEIRMDDIVIVRPGERIAVDGIITEGSSFIDESMISGESMPIEKSINDKVFSGTINQKGSFKFKAQKIGSDTLLAQIIRTVKEAQGSKAPVQKLADKIAGIFVPVVIVLSIFTFIVWMVFGETDAFTHALLNSVSVLVIACPCALGLATPTAIIVGIGKGAVNNILIKDAASLETCYKVNAVILDKTGTITEGKPEITDEVWIKETTQEHLDILFTIESRSEHPLAEAILHDVKLKNASLISLDRFESVTGKGVVAVRNNNKYLVGNKILMIENTVQIPTSTEKTISDLMLQAKTIVYFSCNNELLAIYAIADKIKPTSKTAIKDLQEKGIEVYLLTGDNRSVAEIVAKQVGIKKFMAETLPSDKAAFVKQLQNDHKIVAMVGDGINDSEALAGADIGIAMGKGSDIAMDVAGITLVTSDLTYLSKAITLSGKIVRGIRQNLFWAFIYNIVGIPLAAGILYPINGFQLDPMIAGAAMALSSVSVVMNSLRLRSMKI